MLLAFALWLSSGPVADGWEEAGRDSGVAVYTRLRKGSDRHEVLGVGAVDAPPWVVKNAIDDYDAVRGRMPYLKEARVVKRDDHGAVVYNRTSAPIVTDRDYTIRMTDESFVRKDGSIVYVTRWRADNAEGPPKRSGVVRVEDTEGEWRFEPMDDGKRTRASYRVFADPGGAVPARIADFGTTQMVGDIFQALRERVKDPKYAKEKPPAPALHRDE